MKSLIILATVLLSINLNAQEIKGNYQEGPDYISFNDERVVFSVRGNKGLGIVYTGEGAYEILDGFLVINTEEYNGTKTTIETKPSTKKDTIQLQLFNEKGVSIKDIRAEFLNKSNKTIGLKTSNENGLIEYKINPKVTAIKVSDILYDKVIFDIDKDKDYTVHLVKNRVLEDNTVIFKLMEQTEEKLTMKLLSTDYKKNKPSASQLRRLDKKSETTIERIRKFEKPEM